MSDRGLKIALGVSLVANVFVIGGVVGAIYMRGHSPFAMHGPPGNPLGRAAEMLNPNDRDAFHQTLRAQIQTVRPIQQDSHEARRQAMDDLAAPTFDRAATGALMARARADDEKARGLACAGMAGGIGCTGAVAEVRVTVRRQGTRRRWGDSRRGRAISVTVYLSQPRSRTGPWAVGDK
jgi:uncharacterized membrane protein